VTFLDTNVLLDIAQDDPHWAEWSTGRILAALAQGPLAIDPVVYAELGVQLPDIRTLDAYLDSFPVSLLAPPREALFLAGKAFRLYRRQGGTRSGVLPDFFIGAHAVARGARLLTRDSRRYGHYFPTLQIIAP
jgi:predicted nucleic acid-binding protein